MKSVAKNLIKIAVPVQHNASGFPPIEHEWVWAIRFKDDQAIIDNVPFFSRWAYQDRVKVEQHDGQWFGTRRLRKSDNTSVLLRMRDDDAMPSLRQFLQQRKIAHEAWKGKGLLSVNVPQRGAAEYMLELFRDRLQVDIEIFDWMKE